MRPRQLVRRLLTSCCPFPALQTETVLIVYVVPGCRSKLARVVSFCDVCRLTYTCLNFGIRLLFGRLYMGSGGLLTSIFDVKSSLCMMGQATLQAFAVFFILHTSKSESFHPALCSFDFHTLTKTSLTAGVPSIGGFVEMFCKVQSRT